MYTILKYGGFQSGGVNFDAKIRRESVDPVDLFYGHIGKSFSCRFVLNIQCLGRSSFSFLLSSVFPLFRTWSRMNLDSANAAFFFLSCQRYSLPIFLVSF